LRKYARQTNVRLVVGALMILLIVGDGLIYLFFGPASAAFGAVCILLGLLPILAIILFLFGLEWLVKLADRD
jgi:hypothetical protein